MTSIAPASAQSTDQRVAVFKALADPYRLEILTILAREVRCNCHLQDILDLAPNHLSYHLKVLREAGLIVGARRGRWIDYSIAPDAAELLSDSLPSLDAAALPDTDESTQCEPEE
ncbi:MAG: metalloregulator ArsR/SmtB family transcription factor [Actinomycetia bacterium]|nr:metalloregulator ArsR/SmtB family transcription factor [Actinomycetes bacterium]